MEPLSNFLRRNVFAGILLLKFPFRGPAFGIWSDGQKSCMDRVRIVGRGEQGEQPSVVAINRMGHDTGASQAVCARAVRRCSEEVQ